MLALQALCYVVAIVLLVVAAFGVNQRVSLGLFAAAVALLGYALPVLQHLAH